MRQLAAVVLKHFVHADWLRLAEAEKACVRAALPAGLRDGHGRIRTAVSVVIAAVARTDWPDAWPTLLADLTLPLEEAGAATDTVAGALRCLEICAAELAGEHMRPALQRLLPRLLEVFVNRQGLHGARTRARAVRVLHKLIERASMLCEDAKLMQQLQKGPLAEWVGVLLTELARAAERARRLLGRPRIAAAAAATSRAGAPSLSSRTRRGCCLHSAHCLPPRWP